MKRFMLLTLGVCLLAGYAKASEPGRFGLGIIVGDPFGVTGKYWMNEGNALDFGIGFDSNLELYGDYQFNLFHMTPDNGAGGLFGYLGAGLTFENRDSGSNKFGIRVPIGVDFFPGAMPFSFFGELVPVFVLSPDTTTELDAGIGFRFYFN